ncbi:hypothetical protein LV82_01692 [Albidovulum inexpectatum]|uniref:Methyltransferase domain-containing protein n=1 Tax=Albidovulum inexpectatum TaxID=196587 RepID=A0A2S5JHR9_9RHOB|nr:class I SAM-dependent methyltransferase [Albidovulum inexpectatum]PPB80959.1 hypothetical protein LV82_01692 [Albidovulum inexpectatum]
MTTPVSASHWDAVYDGRADRDLTWHQEDPQPSLDLVLQGGPAGNLSVIDIGAGRARLGRALIASGVRDLALLDLSPIALAGVTAQFADLAVQPRLIVADVTTWTPDRRWNVWHDRAVFHFLTEPEQRAAYRRRLIEATEPGARVIIATFAEDGPERCSGLPVMRHDAASLSRELGDGFELLQSFRHLHQTPSGRSQAFRYSVFRRR